MAAASPRRPERTRETMEGVSNDAAQSIAPSTETTNITPGPRAQRLQDLYGKSLERTLSKLSWENFAACYPTIAKKSEGTLKQVQEQMVAKLQEKCEVSVFWRLEPKNQSITREYRTTNSRG